MILPSVHTVFKVVFAVSLLLEKANINGVNPRIARLFCLDTASILPRYCLDTASIQTMVHSYGKTQDITARSKYPHKKTKSANEVEIRQINQVCNTKIIFRSSFKSHHSMNKSFVSLVSFKNNAANEISIIHCFQQQLL